MQFTPTERTTVRRLPDRGHYERETVHAIVDEAIHCHVGFSIDGRPWVMPTIHTRIDDNLYLHGAPANHMLRSLADGIETCVTITLVDALVVARSAFHHSLDYRSVMVFGRATKVENGDEKRAALHALVEHVIPGRMADARPPSDTEMRKTLVLKLPLTEASAKIRTGGPVDDEDDLALPIWAGIVPCTTTFGAPVAEPEITAGPPAYLASYAR